MDMENDIVKQIRSLDSEMQTLVYENYNKFINATDTIRKVWFEPFWFLDRHVITKDLVSVNSQMKNDFKKMEDEMGNLVSNMDSITEQSDKINATFKDRRQEISKLSGVNTLLKKVF